MDPRKLFDPTTYERLTRCEQEFVESDVHGVAVPGVHPATLLGSAVHAGLRALYDGKSAEEAVHSVRGVWGSHPPVFLNPRAKKGHDHRTLEYAEQIVRMYREVYPLDKEPYELVLNEQYLELPGQEECGIVDRLVRAKSDGLLYVMDTKTTSLFPGEAYAAQWEHNVQHATYLDLAEAKIGERIAGTWADVIYVSTRGYVKTGSDGDFHRYGPCSYSPELRDELRALRAEWRKRARVLQATPELAQKSPYNCMRYNKLWMFCSHCLLRPDLRADHRAMRLASGDWIEARWDPERRDVE